MEETIESYDPLKMDNIRQFLEAKKAKGSPRYYEIFVGTLKVVEKTNNLEDFDGFEKFLNDGTQLIKVNIYTSSAVAPKLTSKHIFKMHPEEPQKEEAGLSGPEIANRISEGISHERIKWEMDQLRKELTVAQKELQEAEKELSEADAINEILEKKVRELEGRATSGEIRLGTTLGLAAGEFVRANANVLAKNPLTRTLAGVLSKEKGTKNGEAKTREEPESEVTFKEKEPEEDPLSEEDKHFVGVLREMQEKFSPDQMEMVRMIIRRMASDTKQIKLIYELLNTK